MLAVGLVAEFQPAGKGLLRHTRIKDLALEVVNGVILRAGRGQSVRQASIKNRAIAPQANRFTSISPSMLVAPRDPRRYPPC